MPDVDRDALRTAAENNPTVAAFNEAEKFGLALTSTSAAYIAEAVFSASGLREDLAAAEARADRAEGEERERVLCKVGMWSGEVERRVRAAYREEKGA